MSNVETNVKNTNVRKKLSLLKATRGRPHTGGQAVRTPKAYAERK